MIGLRRVVLLGVCVAMGGGAVAAPPAAGPKSLWFDNVVEMETSRRSGVTSVWLSNGVRVHHLKLDRRTGQVVVTIALSGGKLLEDARSRGVTELLAGVLDDWDSAAPNASAAERMAGRDIRIDASAGPDAITLRLAGSVGDAPSGMKVVRELLTDARVSAESLDASRDALVRELGARAADARAAVIDAVNREVGGATDPRLLPPDERGLKAMTPATVRDCLSRHTREGGAPIEVAVVGDIALADALALVDVNLGSLSARPRIAPSTNQAERIVANAAKRGPGPLRASVRGVAQIGAKRATIVCGCAGPEMGHLAEQRTLRAAIRVAIDRVKGRLAATERGAAPGGADVGGGVYVSPFAGHGMVLLTATVDAAQSEAVASILEQELGRLAAEPVAAAELAPHVQDLIKSVQDVERDARYWSAALSRCDGLGIDVDEIASGVQFYQQLSPEKLRDEMKAFWRDDGRFTLTLRGIDAPEANGSTGRPRG